MPVGQYLQQVDSTNRRENEWFWFQSSVLETWERWSRLLHLAFDWSSWMSRPWRPRQHHGILELGNTAFLSTCWRRTISTKSSVHPCAKINKRNQPNRNDNGNFVAARNPKHIANQAEEHEKTNFRFWKESREDAWARDRCFKSHLSYRQEFVGLARKGSSFKKQARSE